VTLLFRQHAFRQCFDESTSFHKVCADDIRNMSLTRRLEMKFFELGIMRQQKLLSAMQEC